MKPEPDSHRSDVLSLEPSDLARLSPRESHMVRLALAGMHTKAIAHESAIAPSTVRVLLARAASKLGARSRAELLAMVASVTGGQMPPVSGTTHDASPANPTDSEPREFSIPRDVKPSRVAFAASSDAREHYRRPAM